VVLGRTTFAMNEAVIIGVDESGTGAWAGPFTLAAAAAYKHDAKYMKELGIGDSKALTDKRRRALVLVIADVVLAAVVEAAQPEETRYPGMKPAWRRALVASVERVTKVLPDHIQDVQVIIDGNRDEKTRAALRKLGIINVRFQKKADRTVPAVGAASILAKTARNDMMLELHRSYPEYGWEQNYGYGTKKHREAIKEHGVSVQHRCIKPLADMPKRSDAR